MNPSCPLCGCSTAVYHSTDNWYWCAFCELHFVYPQPSGEELADFYQNEYWRFMGGRTDLPKRFCSWLRAKHRFNLLKPFIPKTGTMLDVGCAGNEWVRRFREEGWQAAGIEHGDSPNDVTFDLIVFSHSLEHMPDPVGALKRFAECLNDGGTIYIEVPLVGERGRYVDWYNRRTYETSRHLFNYTPYSLYDTVLKAGLVPRYFQSGIWLPFGWNPRYIGMIAGKVIK